jgi:hypothetical protein
VSAPHEPPLPEPKHHDAHHINARCQRDHSQGNDSTMAGHRCKGTPPSGVLKHARTCAACQRVLATRAVCMCSKSRSKYCQLPWQPCCGLQRCRHNQRRHCAMQLNGRNKPGELLPAPPRPHQDRTRHNKQHVPRSNPVCCTIPQQQPSTTTSMTAGSIHACNITICTTLSPPSVCRKHARVDLHSRVQQSS